MCPTSCHMLAQSCSILQQLHVKETRTLRSMVRCHTGSQRKRCEARPAQFQNLECSSDSSLTDSSLWPSATELSQSRCLESVWACLPRSLYSVPALHDHSPAEFPPQVNAHVQLLLGDLEWATRCWESILHRLLITNYALSSPMQPGLSLVPRLKPISIHNPVYW